MLLKVSKLLLLQIPIVLLGFFSTAIISQNYGVSGYGQIAYVIAISTMFISLIRYGFDETLIIFLKKSDNPKLIFISSMILRISLYLLSIISLFILYVLGLFDLLQLIAIISFLLISLQATAIYDFLELQENHLQTLIINKIIFCFLILILSSINIDVLAVFIIASFISNIVLLALNLIFYFNKKPFREHTYNSRNNLLSSSQTLLYKNFPVLVASLLSLGLYSVNQIFLKESIGFELLGVFAIQFQVFNMLVVIMKQITRAYKPSLAGFKNTSENKFIKMYSAYFLSVASIPFFCSLGIWLVYSELFGLVFGPEMIGYSEIFLGLCFFLLLRGIHLALIQLSFFNNKNSLVLISNFTSFTTIIFGFWYLDFYQSLEHVILLMCIAIFASILVLAFSFKLQQSETST